ncbi:hypothetical protein FQA39_LY02220 [Lamprigera yunnana]|nr:hypothetical protein FQA39_LY02220 [Lamprigera yunnana]
MATTNLINNNENMDSITSNMAAHASRTDTPSLSSKRGMAEGTPTKPPSTLRRNRERAIKFKENKTKTLVQTFPTETTDKTTQTEIRKGKNKLQKFLNRITTCSKLTNDISPNITESISQGNISEHTVTEDLECKTSSAETEIGKTKITNQIDLTHIYTVIENNMQLTLLEDHRTLTVALRHLVRTERTKKKITFPTIEAVDRIYLKSRGLTTEGERLMFIMAHGIIITDHTKPW